MIHSLNCKTTYKMPDSLEARENPAKFRDHSDIVDAIKEQSKYGSVCVIHGTSGYHPIPESDDYHADDLVKHTPDSKDLFDKVNYDNHFPIGITRKSLYLEKVHLEDSIEYDMVYGFIPSLNNKYFKHLLEKSSVSTIVKNHIQNFIQNSLNRAALNKMDIVIIDGLFQPFKMPHDRFVRKEYLKSIDTLIKDVISRYLPYFKSIVIVDETMKVSR